MVYVELVAALAVLQFIFFTIMTGKARVDAGIEAPAMTGHEGFERMYRVQMNTLEVLVAFLPALLLASNYWSSMWVATLGGIYIVGRFIYWRSYIADPASRGLGFMLSMLPTLILIILAIVGAILAVM